MIDNHIDRSIGKILISQNREESDNHKSSGKLSAGMLGSPLQWQILKHYGVPGRAFDEYTLRKFLRGRQIEKWLLDQIDNKMETKDGKQHFAEYKKCIGYIDAIVNTSLWDFDKGIIPVEIKSVSNLKFKRIESEGQPDNSHRLQGGLYALSEGTDHFAVSYVATDDLRVLTFILETKDVKDEIDGIIKTYDAAVKSKVIPVFEAKEKWQASKKYASYPDWIDLTQEECNKKIITILPCLSP